MLRRNLSKELSLRPDSDIAVLCAFYKVPFSHDRVVSVQAIVDAITSTAMNDASTSTTRVISGRMPSKRPSKQDVIDSVKNDNKLILLRRWLEKGGSPSVLGEMVLDAFEITDGATNIYKESEDYLIKSSLSYLFRLDDDAIYSNVDHLYAIVKILIKRGADVNSIDIRGIPVIFHAAAMLSSEGYRYRNLGKSLIKLLIKNGANINAIYDNTNNSQKMSILDFATNDLDLYGYSDDEDMDEKKENIRKFLTERGFEETN